jgi:hypothetical protein
MISIEYPAMRWQVLFSLATLADDVYQRQVWMDKRYPHEKYYDDLSLQISLLYDNVFPEPRQRIGSVLAPGIEVDRLEELERLLGQLIDELGNEPDAIYLARPEWAEVKRLAMLALAEMVRAGSFE